MINNNYDVKVFSVRDSIDVSPYTVNILDSLQYDRYSTNTINLLQTVESPVLLYKRYGFTCRETLVDCLISVRNIFAVSDLLLRNKYILIRCAGDHDAKSADTIVKLPSTDSGNLIALLKNILRTNKAFIWSDDKSVYLLFKYTYFTTNIAISTALLLVRLLHKIVAYGGGVPHSYQNLAVNIARDSKAYMLDDEHAGYGISANELLFLAAALFNITNLSCSSYNYHANGPVSWVRGGDGFGVLSWNEFFDYLIYTYGYSSLDPYRVLSEENECLKISIQLYDIEHKEKKA